jgi:hypothetical protein
MIYLIFDCVSANRDVTINEEFDRLRLGESDELKIYIRRAPPDRAKPASQHTVRPGRNAP